MTTRNLAPALPLEGHCDPRFSRVREVFAEMLAQNEVGAAIAFTLDGETVVDLWGGHADAEKTRPWQRDTIVNTYSTTKGMTALIAHRLIEQEQHPLVGARRPERALARTAAARHAARRGCRRRRGPRA